MSFQKELSMFGRCGLAVAFLAVGFVVSSAGAALVTDDFNRANSDTVGTMSDGIHQWYELEGNPSFVRIENNQLVTAYDGTLGEGGAAVNNFTLDNGIVQVTLVGFLGTTTTRFATVSYRGATLDDAIKMNGPSGYHLRVFVDWSGDLDAGLYWGTTLLRGANIGTARPDGLDIQIAFDGDTHIVSIGGVEVINFTETTAGRTGAGYIGLGSSWRGMTWDDFSVSSIPEPATALLVATGALFLRGRRNRIAL